MSRLSELYKAIETFKSEGVALDKGILSQISELEENIIKNDILPVLQDSIEPALSQIKRELILVVEYSPQQPISVRLTRKRSFVNELPDAKIIKADPIVEHNSYEGKKVYAKKSPAQNLRITFPNGKVIENKKAVDSIIEFVQYVGVERVRKLGIIRCKIPLISNTVDKKYGSRQKQLGNGWMIMTCTSTESKKDDIIYISKAYNLNVKVELI